MTSDPFSSSEGSSLPPRSRPRKSSQERDNSELDLWSLDSDPVDEPQEAEEPLAGTPYEPADEAPEDLWEEKPSVTDRGAEIGGDEDPPSLPADELGELDDWDEPSGAAPIGTQPELLVEPPEEAVSPKTAVPVAPQPRGGSKFRKSHNLPPAGSSAQPTDALDSDFADLDDWEDSTPDPAQAAGVGAASAGLASLPEQAQDVPEPMTPPAAATARSELAAPAATTTPPLSLRPKLGLSKLERVGLIVVAAVLIIAAAAVLHYSLGRLPTISAGANKLDFPIKGKNLQIENAITFWREPILSGPDRDTIRRGALLIPVIELDAEGGNGSAIRIFFRDDEGNLVGDAISRTVDSGGKITVAGSAGFEDLGDYAAYRTSEDKPWLVEVHEGPSVQAPLQSFTKLFEMPISSLRR